MVVSSLWRNIADHEPEKQAEKWRPGSLGEHNPGGEFSVRRIFLFGFVITHLKIPIWPKESKEIQGIFLGFPCISLHETRSIVVFAAHGARSSPQKTPELALQGCQL